MAVLALKVEPIGDKFQQALKPVGLRTARALNLSARFVAVEIKRRGEIDIRNAGGFSKRWTDAFTVDGAPGFASLDSGDGIELSIYSKIVPYGHVFEYTPLVIRGKPMLWIPLSFTGIKIRARDWGRQFGGLFRVDRKGGKVPLLLSIRDHKPKFYGKTQVTLRKRFHIRDICADVMRGFAAIYAKQFGAS